MRQIPAHHLSSAASARLADWQKKVNKAGPYCDRVDAAKRFFKQHNKIGDKTFDEVKLALTATCPGVRRCHYCEDSCADEVEHVRPKDLYPEQVFSWANYLYACGPCNGPKNNKSAVVVGKKLIDVTRPIGAPVKTPRKGVYALLDLRTDDPAAFLRLDLAGTFLFEVIAKPGSSAFLRATYTVELLALNTRETLRKQRQIAFDGYLARLEQYVRVKGKTKAAIARRSYLTTSIKAVDHPTVWGEMVRQRSDFSQLTKLFKAAPEALAW